MTHPEKQLQLLHISDLHITAKQNFDRSLVFTSFLERLKEDAQTQKIKPGLVLVTGDIACQGIAEEYELAAGFFDMLLKTLGLNRESLLIVPGNHDVNRAKYRPKDIPRYDNMTELNLELENPAYRAELFKGMEDYFAFMHVYCGHLQAVDKNLVPFIAFPGTAIGKIAIVGLNSAWMCRKSPDKGEIAIGEYQIVQAFEKLKGRQDICLVIYAFHHPLHWLMPRDSKACRRFLNNTVCLTGHLHDTEGSFLNDYDGSLYQFQAGGLYLGTESEWPARYQYITIDKQRNTLRLDFRRFASEKRRWIVDAERGDDGRKTFTYFFPEEQVM